ncbi:MAG: Lar family restriction alleviation protein [Oscillospiraceae bacterium]|nr:Lar family restriction alleviation protein [Oscillospiraceae bacterium]MBQ3814065.1 Lar family restriction alleviation protein [Bacteroidales bacterium]
MRNITLENLIFCPLCGGQPAVHSNSRNRFRISCSRCGASTDWMKKTDAVIAWYNMHFTLHANRFLKANPLVRLHD